MCVKPFPQGVCAANLHKWGLASSDKCRCGMVQTFCHISKLHGGGLQRLHSVDDVAANWLEGMVVKDVADNKSVRVCC